MQPEGVSSEEWKLGAEHHELYRFLQDHLDGDEVWRELEHIKAEFLGYREKCVELMSSIRKQAAQKPYAGCRFGSWADGILRGRQKAMGIESPLQEHYEWKCQSGGVITLVFNACEIGYGREEDLRAM